jgi:hypothetical protein
MKKILISSAIIIAVIVPIYLALLYSAERIDQMALSETKMIISEIESFKNSQGRFPEDLKQFIDKKGLSKDVQFGLLSTNINMFIHEDSLFIEYHQSPFGPFHGYSFKTKEWYSTE